METCGRMIGIARNNTKRSHIRDAGKGFFSKGNCPNGGAENSHFRELLVGNNAADTAQGTIRVVNNGKQNCGSGNNGMLISETPLACTTLVCANPANMKQLTQRYKKWLICRAHNERRRKALKRRGGYTHSLSYEAMEALTKKHGTRLEIPAVFCLNENFEEVVDFVAGVRQRFFQWYRPIASNSGKLRTKPRFVLRQAYTDFTCIKKITPAAALLLAAEFDRMRRLSGRPLFTVDLDKWMPDVRGLLDQLGFLKLLQVPSAGLPEHLQDSPVTILPFVSGIKAAGSSAEPIIDALQPLFEGLTDESTLFLYDGLVEAMTNVRQHAYPRNNRYEFKPLYDRWWMTGSFDRTEGRLNVIFLDQGITIPGSLPRSGFDEQVRSYIQSTFKIIGNADRAIDDAEQIDAAMHLGRTSTLADGRGQGLAQMRDFIDSNKNGQLRIISRQGEYTYFKGGESERKNHSNTIGGTLIEWEVYR